MRDTAKRFTFYKSDGFEVWGKEYQDATGKVTWTLRVFSDQDRRIETYEAVAEVPPRGSRIGEFKAMKDAIASWSQSHTTGSTNS
jgi:hypothetical protein